MAFIVPHFTGMIIFCCILQLPEIGLTTYHHDPCIFYDIPIPGKLLLYAAIYMVTSSIYFSIDEDKEQNQTCLVSEDLYCFFLVMHSITLPPTSSRKQVQRAQFLVAYLMGSMLRL
jgi:hypothetical protein